MKKILAILLSATALYTSPAFAAEETTPKTDETQALPDVIEPLEQATTPLLKEGEPTTEAYFRRYCPRGYYLVAYRVRIGRFVIIRYACVRYGYNRPGPGYPDDPRYPGYGY